MRGTSNDDALTPAIDLAAKRKTIFSNESADYVRAARDLLAAEIDVRRALGRLSAQRRALPPGPAIEQPYRFRDAAVQEVGLIAPIALRWLSSAIAFIASREKPYLSAIICAPT